jgi:hypothetical protein
MVSGLIEYAASWPGYGLKRHNDARHPLHALSTLADFGLDRSDPGMDQLISSVMSQQDPHGPFQTLSHLYKQFAGVEGEHWVWMMCDAPTILYALLSFGLQEDEAVRAAIRHLQDFVRDNGWPCAGGDPLPGNFKGPGRREDPCPYANLISLKALSRLNDNHKYNVVNKGINVLLQHWDQTYERKLFMFGSGTDFRKIKYPFVWYDILHVADVLSQYPIVHTDKRFISMLEFLATQANPDGYFTSNSMYRAWKGWSFADKKQASPWLTFLVMRVFIRAQFPQEEDPR